MIAVVMEMLRRPGAHLRPRNVPAARAEHAGARRRLPGALPDRTVGAGRRRAGRTMRERGVIIASGLMAGGALGGVFGAALRLFPWYARTGSRRRSTTTTDLADRLARPLHRRSASTSGSIRPSRGRRRRADACRSRDSTAAIADGDPRHRHALGRRRHEPVGDGALHRRLLVLRRAAARGLHASGGREGARRAASRRRSPTAPRSTPTSRRSTCGRDRGA